MIDILGLIYMLFQVFSKVIQFILYERMAALAGKQIYKTSISLSYRLTLITVTHTWVTLTRSLHATSAFSEKLGYYQHPQLSTKKKKTSPEIPSWKVEQGTVKVRG